MAALLALIRKDLVLHFSTPRALIIGIAVPIAIAAFFGSLFAQDSGPSHVPIVVTDLDHSRLSQALVAALKSEPAFQLRELPEDQARAEVTAGHATAALVLPAGFGDQAGTALFSDRQVPQIGLHYDPSQGMALQLVRGLLTEHVMQTVSAEVFTGSNPRVFSQVRDSISRSSGLRPETQQDLLAVFDRLDAVQQRAAAEPASGAASGAGGLRLPFTLKEEAAGSRPQQHYNSYAHAFAGMSVQFILFSGIELGIGLLALRRMDLWKRLRAAPLSKATLLGSRIASGTAIALLLLAGIYAAAIAVFGVRIEGSVLGFVGVAGAFALMTACFGLLIAAIGRTPEATRPLAIMVTLLLVMLGGAWVPSFVFPAWLQQVSLAAPTRWAVDALDAMTWRGQGLQAAAMPIAVMVGCSALFAAVALWRFDWEE